MINLLAYVEVWEAVVDNEQLVAALKAAAANAAKDVGMELGDMEVTESDVPGRKVVLWPLV